jgi:hypothetical protein
LDLHLVRLLKATATDTGAKGADAQTLAKQ